MPRLKQWAPLTEDAFAALVRAFLESPQFARYSENTKRLWARDLNFAARPDLLGAVSVHVIRPALVQGFLDALSRKPGKASAARSALTQLERWAAVRDLLPRSIVMGTSADKPTGGHLPWTDTEVEIAERALRPDLARLITLAANTGQRISDLIRMCPTDLETVNGYTGIRVTQVKTGREVWVPVNPALADAMATWERRPGPFLLRYDGKPWRRTEDVTMAWTWQRDHNPALAGHVDRGLVLHGLRACACVRLRRLGASIMEICSIVGMSAGMVTRYTRHSAQQENAMAAVIRLGTYREQRADNSKAFKA